MEIRRKVKIFLPLLVASFAIFFSGCGGREDKALPSIVRIGNSSFNVETVTTPTTREQGLSGREALCQNCGMLFVFEKEGRYPFWMKGMKFDLDMLWIKDGKVVFIKRDVNHAGGKKNIIDPGVLAEAVLEIPAGGSVRAGIEIGSAVSFE